MHLTHSQTWLCFFCCLFTIHSFLVHCHFCRCLGIFFTPYTVCKSVFVSVHWTGQIFAFNLFIKLYLRGFLEVLWLYVIKWRGQYIVRKTTEWILHKCMLCEFYGLIIPYLIDWEFSLKTLFMFGTKKLHRRTTQKQGYKCIYFIFLHSVLFNEQSVALDWIIIALNLCVL